MKYKVLCKIVIKDLNKAIEISEPIKEALPTGYLHEIRTSYDSKKLDEKNIDHQILENNLLLEEKYISEDDYDHNLLRIIKSIHYKYTFKSKELLEKLHTNWGDIIDIQTNIAQRILKLNFEEGLEYTKQIDMDFQRVEVLSAIIDATDDKSKLTKIFDFSKTIDDKCARYELMFNLSKKIDIKHEDLFEVSKSIYSNEFNYSFFNQIIQEEEIKKGKTSEK